MPDYFPQINLPEGLAVQTARMREQLANSSPWAELAHQVGNVGSKFVGAAQTYVPIDDSIKSLAADTGYTLPKNMAVIPRDHLETMQAAKMKRTNEEKLFKVKNTITLPEDVAGLGRAGAEVDSRSYHDYYKSQLKKGEDASKELEKSKAAQVPVTPEQVTDMRAKGIDVPPDSTTVHKAHMDLYNKLREISATGTVKVATDQAAETQKAADAKALEAEKSANRIKEKQAALAAAEKAKQDAALDKAIPTRDQQYFANPDGTPVKSGTTYRQVAGSVAMDKKSRDALQELKNAKKDLEGQRDRFLALKPSENGGASALARGVELWLMARNPNSPAGQYAAYNFPVVIDQLRSRLKGSRIALPELGAQAASQPTFSWTKRNGQDWFDDKIGRLNDAINVHEGVSAMVPANTHKDAAARAAELSGQGKSKKQIFAIMHKESY